MRIKKIEFSECFSDFCKAMSAGGAFLLVPDRKGRPNPMTIGWATLGVIWGEPIITVMVRPSRFTHGLLEKTTRFSVCVPLGGLKSELAVCGTRSGRDIDKIKECKLKVAAGQAEGVSVLADCDLFFECQTVHKTHVIRHNLEAGIVSRYYPEGDFHTVYNARILHAYRRK
ncbi:MAG: flavin reductase [Elusimicrobiota bacterium]|jgi:flavin reductase (DIM6/NTAB) family NADH-FMN oxidoreductase RutF